MARNKKDEAEYLKMQMEIADAIKRQTEGIKSFVEAQKTLQENVRLRKIALAEIAALEEELKNATEDEAKLIKEKIADHNKEIQQLTNINKQLVSMKNALRAAANEVRNQLNPGFNAIYQKSMDIDGAIRQTSASLGLASSMMSSLRSNINQASLSAEKFGYKTEELLDLQNKFNDEVGKQILLSSDSLESIVMLEKGLGLAKGEMASLAGQMELYGIGASQSVELVHDLRKEAQKQGVSANKVIKSFQKNLRLMDRLDFSSGVKGMMEMAAYAEKYKIQMEDVASLAEKVFRPEGAIEAAANLQILGGSLSQMGDPFDLMYKARYAPEELAKSLSKAASQSATFNEQTGQFKLNALELDRMTEAAQALGIPVDNLRKMAIETAKINMFDGMLGSIDKKDRDMVTGLAQFGKDGAFIQFGSDKVLLKNLTQTQVDILKQSQDDAKKLAENNQTFQDALDGLKGQLTYLGSSVLLPLIDIVTPLLKGMTDLVTKIPDSIKPIVGALVLFGKTALDFGMWVARGVALRRGFDSGGTGKGLLRSLNPFKGSKKNISAGTSLSSNLTSQSTSGGGTPNTKGQSGFLDKLKGIKPKQLLATGAAMVMIAGSVWILSDAMVRMKEASVGFEQVGMVLGLIAGMAIPLGLLGSIAAPGLLAVGGAMLMMGGAVWLAVQGMTSLMEAIGPNGESIMKAGVGFMAMGAGVGVLTASLIGLGAAAPIALLGLGVLTGTMALLSSTAESLNKVDFKGVTDGINNINTENLDKLKELTKFLGEGKPIQIEFSDMKLKGDIMVSGEGGGKNNTDWINDPVFVSKLKDMVMDYIDKGKNGGKN